MIAALTDFGSTFTKVSLVDECSGELLAAGQHPTTVATDVMEGFDHAYRAALRSAGLRDADRRLAASSAAGGLRMAAVGLVDDLTASAARRCALSAGAKVDAVFSGSLGPEDVSALGADPPDIILFAGGTDGGERRRVLDNARAVAAARGGAVVVVACNREIAEAVAHEFLVTGHEVIVVDNVLPDVDQERSRPAREAIREVFITRVVRSRELSSSAELFDSIVMPSPAAVLACAELIADRSAPPRTATDVMIIDVGGATTDVHSVVGVGASPSPERIARGAPAPAVSVRSVEGDLGVRWGADAVLAHDRRRLTEVLDVSSRDLERSVAALQADPGLVPADELHRRLDRALAASCVFIATERHVGRIETRYEPGEGAQTTVNGPDLRTVGLVLATGGPLVCDPHESAGTVAEALARLRGAHAGPRDPAILVDENYICAAAGLLSTVNPDAARRLLADALPGFYEPVTGPEPTLPSRPSLSSP